MARQQDQVLMQVASCSVRYVSPPKDLGLWKGGCERSSAAGCGLVAGCTPYLRVLSQVQGGGCISLGWGRLSPSSSLDCGVYRSGNWQEQATHPDFC